MLARYSGYIIIITVVQNIAWNHLDVDICKSRLGQFLQGFLLVAIPCPLPLLHKEARDLHVVQC